MIETYDQRQLRLLLPDAIGHPCRLCGSAMTDGQANAWLLDVDLAGDAVVHAWCKGARMTARMAALDNPQPTRVRDVTDTQ